MGPTCKWEEKIWARITSFSLFSPLLCFLSSLLFSSLFFSSAVVKWGEAAGELRHLECLVTGGGNGAICILRFNN